MHSRIWCGRCTLNRDNAAGRGFWAVVDEVGEAGYKIGFHVEDHTRMVFITTEGRDVGEAHPREPAAVLRRIEPGLLGR